MPCRYRETVQSLQHAFYDRVQQDNESLVEFSRELIQLDTQSLKALRDKSLIGQFVAGTKHPSLR